MLTESFVVATETVRPVTAHLPSNLKDVGIVVHELQPQVIFRQGFKKSSVARNCLAASRSHLFAAQAGKSTVIVYYRGKGHQEALVPFPQKITSLVYSENAAVLIIGTHDGKLMLWETATGRVTSSAASHIDAVTSLVLTPDGSLVVSASPDSTVHIWSVRDLISIERQQESLNHVAPRNEPVASFTQHQSAVTALAVGNSRQNAANFIVSAGEDKSCYIWSLETQQLLRTYLLTEVPECIAIDPAGRALFLGSRDGSIQQIDLMDIAARSKTSVLSTPATIAANPVQLKASNRWHAHSSTIASAANCIDISYDGTLLLTGHASGKVLRWEVAKKRLIGEVTSLTGQAVTCLQMLRPTGFQSSNVPRYILSTIIKPRLDLDTDEHGVSTLAIPPNYKIHAQITQPDLQKHMSEPEIAFHTSKLPQSLIDDAIQALARKKVSGGNKQTDEDPSGANAVRLDDMEKELASLRAQVADSAKQHAARVERHMIRMQKRDAIGQQKREAFFEAKKAGRNGDEAMKRFEPEERNVDVESDEDAMQ